MLVNLHVKNLALIEETEVNFQKGLNILTGETGAGKSIILGSINYALGAKVEHDIIRRGAEYAFVELVFQLEKEGVKEAVRALDMPLEEDGTLIISRKIMPSRTILRVNGETVTQKQVKELAALLMDIHGQKENQSLLSEKRQREMLDQFAKEKLEERKLRLGELVKEYRVLEKEQEALSMDDAARERELSLIRYEVNEIEMAELKPGEDEELETRYQRMKNGKRICESLQVASNYMALGEPSILDLMGYLIRELQGAAQLDKELEGLLEQFQDAESILQDGHRYLGRYMEEFNFSQEEFAQLEARLDLMNTLKLKYGDSIEKILQYGNNRKQELEKLENLAIYLDELSVKLEEKKRDILQLCEEIHAIRAEVAALLSARITDVLKELNFLQVQFEIMVMQQENFSSEGYDTVCYMISLNPGEACKPISAVASGGELSRIMLALKTVFAEQDDMDTLVFDEIDAGISGVTAWKVSEQMGAIAKQHQILCITHLPQIAAMADTHFRIEKTQEEDATFTNIYALGEQDMLEEIGRLLGSDSITETVLLNAKELKEQARQKKAEFEA